MRATRRWLIGVLLLASAAAGVAAIAGPGNIMENRVAEIDLTVHPAMVKGPSTAAVTIVEFSDYQ